MKATKSFPNPSLFAFALAALAALLTQFGGPSAFASTFYWENNSTSPGFGTASGTWAQNNTTGGRWTTSVGGTIAGSATQSTTASDSFNFGTAADGLGAGTITVSGSVTMGNTTYGSASGAIVLSGGTAINFSVSPTITVNNTVNTIDTVIGGAGTSFTKAGTGKLILGGANIYAGNTIISAGTLALGAANRIPDGAGKGNVSVTGTLDLNTFTDTINGLSGAGTVDSVAGGTPTLIVGANDQTAAFSGVIKNTAGTLSLTKTGSGTQTLSGTSSYGGTTTISAGTLQLGANDVIPDGAGKGNVTVAGRLDLYGFDDTVNGLSGEGTVDNSAASTTSTLTVGNNNQSSIFSGVLQNSGSGSTLNLIKTGSGTLTINSANTLSGTLSVNAGTLALGLDIANPFANVTGITLAGGTILSTTNNGVTFGAATPITLGSSGTTARIAFGRDATAQGTLTLNGAIGGAGHLIFTTTTFNSGNFVQSVVLGAANTYAGTTLITTADSGTTLAVVAGVDNALPPTTVLTLDGNDGSGSGRTVSFDLNGHTQILAGLNSVTGRTSRNQRVTSVAAASLTVSNSSDHTYGSPATITGAISLTKQGAGKLTLTSANGHTGNTTIGGGTLALSGSGGMASTPSIAVGSGATFDVIARTSTFALSAAQTLRGNGSIAGPISISGIVAAGTSIGTLTFGGATTNSGTIITEITNGPSADKLVFNSSFHNLGGTLTVVGLGTLVSGTTYDLFDFNGGAPTGVAFAATNLPHGPSHWLTGDLLAGGTITFTNLNPVAQNLTMGVVHGGTVVLPVIGGKNGATDANGDALTVTAVGTPTSGSASFGASNVTYTADGAVGTNTFTFTVSDAFGATDTRTVTVIVTDAQGFNLVSAGVNGGAAVLQYLGIPGTNYALEIAHALPATNWVPVITNPASVNGYLYFTNPISLSPTNDYYRTRYVP